MVRDEKGEASDVPMREDDNGQGELPIEDNRGTEEEEIVPFRYSITSYGADYPVDGLVARLNKGDVFIPSFQRGFVWTLTQASRFIESLLLGLPVPGIFLSKEPDTQKLLVIDGQQRLRTLQYFYGGVFANTGREFALRGVQKGFTGCTYKKLQDEDRRRLDDGILHATVVRQEEPSDDQSSVYYIFERLNTGGTQLHDQEIRACLYHGEFNELLRQLNDTPAWRKIYGRVNSRMRDQELILRFLALNFRTNEYARPMKEFLNDFMGKNRHLQLHGAPELKTAFVRSVETAERSIGHNAFKPTSTFNAAVFDSVMVALNQRLARGAIKDWKALRRRYESLLKRADFMAACERATADEQNVKRRLEFATAAFADVK